MQSETVSIRSINYDSPAALRAYLADRDLGMLKRFGQNFLINRSARERLAAALQAGADDRIWEVGPGLGAMTALLLNGRRTVVGFEIDRGFIAALGELFPDSSGFKLVAGDVLKTWPTEAASAPAPYFFGNLPYNIAAVLLANLIEAGQFFQRLVVTVQKETADRMIAAPGEANYSSFSVLCASAYRCRRLMIMKPASFFPEPQVDSAAVVLERLENGAAAPLPLSFHPIVRALFAARRKTIRNNLEAYAASRLRADEAKPIRRRKASEIAAAVAAAAAVDPGARAETLAVSEFIALAAAVDAMGKSTWT